MKTSLDLIPKKLPTDKIAELEKVVEIIKHRFELKKDDPKFELLMVILFGSYARGDWVEDRQVKQGITYEYNSDFDILVVTARSLFKRQWIDLSIEDDIEEQRYLTTEVNITHHGIDSINGKLRENNYFFTDIVKEGVMLYDSGNCTFAEPDTITSQERAKIAQEDLEYWIEEGDGFYTGYEFYLEKGFYKKAVFLLHQAAECYYTAVILVYEYYKPKTHNLTHLRGKANSIDNRFKEVFPDATKEEKERFQLLKRAYIDSRYKKDYTIAGEELKYLGGRVKILGGLTREVPPENIARLRGMKTEGQE